MSSGFVSGGTTDAPLERSDEWLAAQQELEANRRRQAQESSQASGRSLFETLEANKAAKQEAFEEANKLKNQFRALDEDEVEFLDSVLESTRAEEERVRRETAEGLLIFRRQQEEADKKALEGQRGEVVSPVDEEEEWAAGGGTRKRKRKGVREKGGLRGVKLKRSSTSETAYGSSEAQSPTVGEIASPRHMVKDTSMERKESKTTISSSSVGGCKATSAPSPSKPPIVAAVIGGLGLVDYGSESEDDG